jgi:threonine aldolase
MGTVYNVDEIRAISEIASRRSVALHMDGARFASAVAQLGVTPAEITWKAGVDILSFGATKNGCIAAEAIVIFKHDLAKDMPYIRKRAGQLFSKSRFVAAQFDAYFRDGLWLNLARQANAMGARLRSGLASTANARVAWPTNGNETFAVMKKKDATRLRGMGAALYEWPQPHGFDGHLAGDEDVIRLVTAFSTRADEIDAFLTALRA